MTFFPHLLSIVTSHEMTIKHLMYTQKVRFLYTERACVLFFSFWNSPRKIFYVNRSVATILDQRESFQHSSISLISLKLILSQLNFVL